MRKAAVFCFGIFMVFLMAFPLSAGRVLVVPGTGDSQILLREVAKAMEDGTEVKGIIVPWQMFSDIHTAHGGFWYPPSREGDRVR